MKKFLLFILLVVSISFLWAVANRWSANNTLSGIKVYGNEIVDEAEIINIASVDSLASMGSLDLASIREQVMSHPFVKDATVTREFPSFIGIYVDERKPAALLLASRMALVDEEGVVLPLRHKGVMKNLPAVSGDFSIPPVGSIVNNRSVLNGINLICALERADDLLYHLISEINIQDEKKMVMYTVDNGIPVYLSGNPTAHELVAFREFWLTEALTLDVKQIKRVDLRFDGQIIVSQ